MSEKLFNKNLPRYCEYCAYGNYSKVLNSVICEKRGVTDSKDCCKKYRYDPLKRDPHKLKISNNFNADDFSL